MKGKKLIKQIRTILVVGLAFVLFACGGGSGGGSAPNQTGSGGTGSGGTGGGGTGGGGTGGGGTGGSTGGVLVGGLLSGGLSLAIDVGSQSGVAVGVTEGGSGSPVIGSIQALSSIVIDGRVINTDSAFIYVEGRLASQSDLRPGQSVAVLTDTSGSVANGVFYRANVKGPATTVNVIDANLAEAELTVLGQLVRTDATTTFNDVDVANLAVNDLYEISGSLNSSGVIQASYIERKTALTDYKVTGTVTNLTSTTFSIEGLVVDFASATLQDFSPAIADGDVIEVRGAASDFTAPDHLVASEVELLTVLQVGDGTPLSVEGFVDRFVSATDFDVQTIPITSDGSTTYVNGDSNSIALGVKLVARGSIQPNGVLLADSITIQPTNAIRAEGQIEAVDVATGTITALGVTFSTRDLLRFEDKSNAKIDPLTLADLGVGDEVEIRGFLDGGEVVATRIERDDPRDRARLRGLVSAEDASARTVTVLGVTLTGQAGITEYQDVNDNVITAEQFHELVDLGDFVQGSWDVFSDTSQRVDELSIED